MYSFSLKNHNIFYFSFSFLGLQFLKTRGIKLMIFPNSYGMVSFSVFPKIMQISQQGVQSNNTSLLWQTKKKNFLCNDISYFLA